MFFLGLGRALSLGAKRAGRAPRGPGPPPGGCKLSPIRGPLGRGLGSAPITGIFEKLLVSFYIHSKEYKVLALNNDPGHVVGVKSESKRKRSA